MIWLYSLKFSTNNVDFPKLFNFEKHVKEQGGIIIYYIATICNLTVCVFVLWYGMSFYLNNRLAANSLETFVQLTHVITFHKLFTYY